MSITKDKKGYRVLWMMLAAGVMAVAICLLALIPRSADTADMAMAAGSTVLDLSPTDGVEIASQSDRFSVHGQGIVVCGTAPITIKGDGTGGEWSVLVKDARSITIEDNTKISNAFYALNIPESAIVNTLGKGIVIDGRIIAASAYKPKDWKDAWRMRDGRWNLTDSRGNPVRGKVYSSGSWYYCDRDGYLVTGWVYSNGSWYFFNPDAAGAMAKGWVKWNGSWYFMGQDGRMKTGWVSWKGSRYWLKPDGAMASNEQLTIKGKTYTFNENGALR